MPRINPRGCCFRTDADGKVRLAQPGETWFVVEGVKDAAALWALGLLAVGLPSCRIPARAGLGSSAGLNIVLVPDRDSAGEEGAKHNAALFHGVAATIKVAILPAELKEKDGADCRDILKMPNGRELLEQAISDAAPWEPPKDESGTDAPITNGVRTVIPSEDGTGKTIIAPLTMTAVLAGIRKRTEDWPRSAQMLFVPDGRGGVAWLESTAAMFGWLATRAGVIGWHKAFGCVSQEHVLSRMLADRDQL